MEKDKKANRKTVIIVGISVVLLAVLLVSVAIFYPSVKAKSELKKITDRLSDGSLKSATVYDPDEGKDLFNAGGVESIANEDERANLKTLILKITDGATYSSKDTEEISFDYDLRIRFRFSNDETVYFYLSDGKFYITNDGVRYFFATKDESAYRDLTSFAYSLIKPESP